MTQLSEQDVLDRLYGFLAAAKQVQELKDQLLYLHTFGRDPELLDRWMDEQEAMTSEIGDIYMKKMVPLVEDVLKFLDAHADVVETVLAGS